MNKGTVLYVSNLILFLLFFGYSIYKKETIIRDGKLILIPLAPRDPRSLMQGDYMFLSYDWRTIRDQSVDFKRGCLVFKYPDETFTPIRLEKSLDFLNKDEYCIRYFGLFPNIKIGAESYFFQEGKAKDFQSARFVGLRLSPNGDKVIIGLFDETKQLIGSELK